MAGRAANPLSVNQAPQYGDKVALDEFRSDTTTTAMTGTPVQKTPAGRPATASGGGQLPAGVTPEAYSKMQTLARAKRTYVFWEGMAASNPSPATNFFRFHAKEAYDKAAKAVYSSTPNFE